MKHDLFSLMGLFLALLFPTLALAQPKAASDYERSAVLRELEFRLVRERGVDTEIRIEFAESYAVSNSETGVRGRALFRARNRDWEPLWFDSVLERRGSRVTRLDWGYGNRRGDSRPGDYRPGDSRPGDYRPGNDRNDDRYQGGNSGVLRNGRYEIQLVATNRMLDIGNGNQVVQREAGRSRSQQWDLEAASGNFYYIRSAETGEVLTVEGRGENGDNIVLTRERRNDDFQLWEVRPGPDNGYYFIARNGKSLDSPSSARYDGGRMQLYNRNDEANQRFRLRLISDRSRPDDRPRDRGRDDYRPGSGSGRLIWSGRVDGEIELEVRGNSVRERHISGQAPYDVRTNSGWSLPRRDVIVRVVKLSGRGRVEVISQPTSRNGYVAFIRINDADRGADDYELEISWN